MDTYLTVCFGRPSSTFLKIEEDLFLYTMQTNLTYHECMYLISGTIAKTLKLDATQNRFVEITQAISALKSLEERSLPHLKDKANGRNVQERLEYFCLQISSNFGLTYLALRALNTDASDFNLNHTGFIEDRRTSCLRTLQGFLDMQAASGLPERNWVFLHNCLSSALLLGYDSPNDNFETKKLQKSFLNVLIHLKEEAKTADDLHSAFWSHYSPAIEKLESMCNEVPDMDRETQYLSSAGDYVRPGWENMNLFDSIL